MIDRETELVWLLAGSSERREATRERAEALSTEVSFRRVGEIMDRHRSRLVLGQRARAAGLAPPEFDEEWRRLRDLSARRVLLFESLTARLTQALEHGGIAALPLKGPGLAAAAHGDPALRLSSDIDILVPAERLEDATDVLARLGYRIDHDDRSALHLTLVAENGALPPVELHWRLHWYGDAFARALLREAEIDEHGGRRPGNEAMMAILLVCYARDGFLGLRLPLDISGLADLQDGGLDWRRVWRFAERDAEIRPSLSAAAAMASTLLGVSTDGVPVPDSRRQRAAMRLSNWEARGDTDQLGAVLRLTDLLLAPPRLGRRFVPARFRPFPSTRRNALYLLRTLLRWIPATASIARGRWAHPPPERPATAVDRSSRAPTPPIRRG